MQLTTIIVSYNTRHLLDECLADLQRSVCWIVQHRRLINLRDRYGDRCGGGLRRAAVIGDLHHERKCAGALRFTGPPGDGSASRIDGGARGRVD